MSSTKTYQSPAAGKKTAPTMEPSEKKIGGAKNGGKRMIAAPGTQAPKYYPSEDKPVAKKTRKSIRPTRLRASITPGTVLILLAGRFRGKRVVFLKQLASGLLLVTGPFKINGVPLRRVNQAYVIATSTKVDIGSVEVNAKINDAYFAKESGASKSREAEFFNDGTESKGEKKPKPERSNDQKTLDKQVIAVIKKQPLLASYLHSTFGLSKGEYPHKMQF